MVQVQVAMVGRLALVVLVLLVVLEDFLAAAAAAVEKVLSLARLEQAAQVA
jgi:hypothetical protein